MAKTKINITLDDELLSALDDYCDRNYMNRSWVISQSVNRTINEQKLIDAIADMSIAVKKAAELGTMDDDTFQKLQEFEVLSKLFVK